MTSPFLTCREAAAFLRYKTVAGFLKAVRLHAIPHVIRGRERLFLQDDLIASWRKPAYANLRDAKRRAS